MKNFNLILIFLFFNPNLILAEHKKSNPPKLIIYFNTTDCDKCYLPLSYLNIISKKIDVECVVEPYEKEYIESILQQRGVNPSAYSIRPISENEKTLTQGIGTKYLFKAKAVTLFGGFLVLSYVYDHLDSLLNLMPARPQYFSGGLGYIPVLQPLGISGNKSFIFDQKINTLYVDSSGGSKAQPAIDYFTPDSTYVIYKVDTAYKTQYFKVINDPKSMKQTEIYSITSWKNNPVFIGSFMWSITPLFKIQKRNFLVYYSGKVVSREKFNYIDNSNKLVSCQCDIVG